MITDAVVDPHVASFFPCGSVPHTYHAVVSRGCHRPSIRGETDSSHQPAVSDYLGHQGVALAVADTDRPFAIPRHKVLAVGRMSDATNTFPFLGNGLIIGLPESVEVTPFKTSEIVLSHGLPVSVNEIHAASDVTGVPGLGGQSHVGVVDQFPRIGFIFPSFLCGILGPLLQNIGLNESFDGEFLGFILRTSLPRWPRQPARY